MTFTSWSPDDEKDEHSHRTKYSAGQLPHTKYSAGPTPPPWETLAKKAQRVPGYPDPWNPTRTHVRRIVVEAQALTPGAAVMKAQQEAEQSGLVITSVVVYRMIEEQEEFWRAAVTFGEKVDSWAKQQKGK